MKGGEMWDQGADFFTFYEDWTTTISRAGPSRGDEDLIPVHVNHVLAVYFSNYFRVFLKKLRVKFFPIHIFLPLLTILCEEHFVFH